MPEEPSARDAQLAAEISPDVGAEQIALVYAEALVAAGERAGNTAELLADFDALLVEVLDRFPKFEEILSSGRISHGEKVAILDRTLAGQTPLLLNFLKVLSRRGRLDGLRVIHRRAHEIFDRLRNRVPVRVTTATPLPDALADQVAARLREIIGGEPVLQRVTDPSVIGGVVLRVGDTVYDGSVATQLQKVREQMIERSVHEIQSRRDRFRHPAGD